MFIFNSAGSDWRRLNRWASDALVGACEGDGDSGSGSSSSMGDSGSSSSSSIGGTNSSSSSSSRDGSSTPLSEGPSGSNGTLPCSAGNSSAAAATAARCSRLWLDHAVSVHTAGADMRDYSAEGAQVQRFLQVMALYAASFAPLEALTGRIK